MPAFPLLGNLAPGILQHTDPITFAQHQLCSCPPLQTTKILPCFGTIFKIWPGSAVVKAQVQLVTNVTLVSVVLTLL